MTTPELAGVVSVALGAGFGGGIGFIKLIATKNGNGNRVCPAHSGFEADVRNIYAGIKRIETKLDRHIQHSHEED